MCYLKGITVVTLLSGPAGSRYPTLMSHKPNPEA